MNLRFLTKILRSRYLDTQAVLCEPLSRLYAFGTVEDRYLQSLIDIANDYYHATPIEQKEIAKDKARGYLNHIRLWSRILASNLSNTKDSVFAMSKQTENVRRQIRAQLRILQITIRGLESAMETDKDDK